MKSLFLLAVIGLASCAPQWPYRDSMQPYYYGYPGQTPYVYRPQIEDDEGDDVPTGRQDLPVVSQNTQDGQGNFQLNQQSNQQQQQSPVPLKIENSPVVVETGSAAPVIQAQDPKKNQQPLSQSAQAPPNVNNPNAPREPPPFPPATTPRPPAAPVDEDDSDEEEEDEDEDADAEADEEDQNENSEESEEEADRDRRRQEPIKVMSEEVPASTPQPSPPAPVVVNDTVSSSVEDVEEVVKEVNTNKKHPVRIEALVPGYVTDQGEVLVPVDTVTGDQPISIVPDPYTPPARGIPASEFVDSPYFYAETLKRNFPGRRSHYRQEEGEGDDDTGDVNEESEEEDEEEAEDEESSDEEEAEDEKKEQERPKIPLAAIPARAPSNEDDERDSNVVHGGQAPFRPIKGRNEKLNNFPPSRSPQLFAVINSKIPVNQNFLNRHYQGQSFVRRNPYGQYYGGAQSPAFSYPGQYYGNYAQQYSQYRPSAQQVYSKIIYKNQQSPKFQPRPNYFSAPSYYPGVDQQQGYPVRRKNPIASVEFSLESEEEYGSPYGSPYDINRPSFSPYYNRFRPTQQKIIYRRRPGTAPEVKRPTFINRPKTRPANKKPVVASNNKRVPAPNKNVNKKKVVNNNQPNIGLLAVYNLGEGSNQKFGGGIPQIPQLPFQFIRRRPTPVIKQDDNVSDDIEVPQDDLLEPNYYDDQYYESPEILRLSRRDAKQIKRKKEGSGKKVNSSDPLGLLGKINNRKY